MYRRMKIEDKLPEECSKLARAYDDDDRETSDSGESGKSPESVSFSRPRTYATARPASMRGHDGSSGGESGGGGGHNDAHQQSGVTGSGARHGVMSVWSLILTGTVIYVAHVVPGF